METDTRTDTRKTPQQKTDEQKTDEQKTGDQKTSDDKRKAKKDAPPVRDCREAPAPNPNGDKGQPDPKIPINPPPPED